MIFEKNSFYKYRIFIAVILLSITALLSYKSIDQHLQLQQKKYDLAELDNIGYGLFNASAWAIQISEILNKKIDEIDITQENRERYEAVIAQVLDQLIRETDTYIQKRNQSNSDDSFMVSIQKTMKQEATDLLIDFEDIRRNAIPILSSTLLQTLQETETRQQIKVMFREKINHFSAENFNQISLNRVERILLKNNCQNRTICKERLSKEIENISYEVQYAAWSTLLLTGLLFFTLLFHSRELSRLSYVLLMLSSLLLLILGILTPMIEIEAQISSFTLMLQGEPVQFTQQVLFFQSKSIVDVISLLIQTEKIDMIIVAGLLGVFSILFPLLKVLASVIYIGSWHGFHQNRYVKFFALSSAKYSMADVLVVAMFMAFIGLDGMVSHQLENLYVHDQKYNLLTYNGTGLQEGFYLFLGFVFFSMLFSSKINHKSD